MVQEPIRGYRPINVSSIWGERNEVKILHDHQHFRSRGVRSYGVLECILQKSKH